MRTENETQTTTSDLQMAILESLAHCTSRRANLASCAERAEDARELVGQLEGLVIDGDEDLDLVGLCQVILRHVEMARKSHARLQNDVTDRAKEHLYARASEAFEDTEEMVRNVAASMPSVADIEPELALWIQVNSLYSRLEGLFDRPDCEVRAEVARMETTVTELTEAYQALMCTMGPDARLEEHDVCVEIAGELDDLSDQVGREDAWRPCIKKARGAMYKLADELLREPGNSPRGGSRGARSTGMPASAEGLPVGGLGGQDEVVAVLQADEIEAEINNLQHGEHGDWDLTAVEDLALRAAWAGPGLAYSLEGIAGGVVAMPGTAAELHRARETGVLLAQPASTPQPTHSTVYSLQGGRVGSAPLARYRLPDDMRDDILIMPGDVPSTAVASLDYLATLADRMAPWVRVHCVPKGLTRMGEWDDFGTWGTRWHVGGQDYAAWGGLACGRHKMVFVCLATEARMASVLCHELMHIMWRTCLSQRAIAVLTEAVGQGHEWRGSYMGSVEERVCRLFQAYSEGRMEGLPGAVMDMSAAGIMEMVWSGELADHQITKGFVPHAKVHRARRGMPAPKTEVAEPVKVAKKPDWADKVIRVAAWLLGPTEGLRAV